MPPRASRPIGIALLDKPAGPSSFALVADLRRRTRARTGHAGTLDPFATGLLVLLSGLATKLAPCFVGLDKRYVTDVDLTATTSTGDPEGEILERHAAPSRAEVDRRLALLRGEIELPIPAASAVKIGGERAYRLARQGIQVEMPLRRSRVHALDVIAYRGDSPSSEPRRPGSSGGGAQPGDEVGTLGQRGDGVGAGRAATDTAGAGAPGAGTGRAEMAATESSAADGSAALRSAAGARTAGRSANDSSAAGGPVTGTSAVEVVRLGLHVGSGTYVRSIAAALGGHCVTLRRTAVGPFEVEEADPARLIAVAAALARLPAEALARVPEAVRGQVLAFEADGPPAVVMPVERQA